MHEHRQRVAEARTNALVSRRRRAKIVAERCRGWPVAIIISSDDPRSIRAITIAAGAAQWLRCRTTAGDKAYGIPSASRQAATTWSAARAATARTSSATVSQARVSAPLASTTPVNTSEQCNCTSSWCEPSSRGPVTAVAARLEPRATSSPAASSSSMKTAWSTPSSARCASAVSRSSRTAWPMCGSRPTQLSKKAAMHNPAMHSASCARNSADDG